MANMAVTKTVLGFSVESGLPLVMWGEAGIGKTEAVYQKAAEMDRNLVVLHLATQDVPDLIGVPVVHEDKTVYAKPSWMVDENTDPSIADPNKPTIYFLDEFNRGSRPVLACMLPFLLSGQIHEHKIRPEDCVVAACNFCDDDYDVTELSDKALRDRCGHIIVKPTASEWLEWAKDKIDETTYEVCKLDEKLIEIETKELDFTVVPSRRKLVQIMSHFKDKDESWVKSCGSHILNAYLGSSFASVYMSQWEKMDRGLSVEEIFKMTESTRKKIDKLTTGEVRVDVLNAANLGLVKKLKGINKKKGAKKKISEKCLDNIFEYLFKLPADILRVVAEDIEKDVVKINGEPFEDMFVRRLNEAGQVDMIDSLLKTVEG